MNTGTKALWMVTGLLCAFVVAMVIFGKTNDLEINQELKTAYWLALVPITALLMFKAYQKAKLSELARPAIALLLIIFMGPFFAIAFSIGLCTLFTAAMDRFNVEPVEIERAVSGFESDLHSHSRNFRFHLYFGHDGKEHANLYLDDLQFVQTDKSLNESIKKGVWPYEWGRKVTLVGRKSWAGTVVDEVRLAPPDRKNAER
jgi:hypothetical protein